MLARYLNANRNGQPDYRATYAYAEILQHKSKTDEAKPYFAQAEKQVSAIQGKDVDARLDEARLLYRNNRLQEALTLYRQLRAEHPENKTVQADFAELLIETKQFDEASLVLSQ